MGVVDGCVGMWARGCADWKPNPKCAGPHRKPPRHAGPLQGVGVGVGEGIVSMNCRGPAERPKASSMSPCPNVPQRPIHPRSRPTACARCSWA